jgi:hypothetical protein
VANHGKSICLDYDHEVPNIEMPEEFSFAPWKRARIWEEYLKDGVHGYGSLCHVRLPGTQHHADDTWDVVGCQCTGALVMQQRELLRFVERRKSALSAPGAARVAGDMLGREISQTEVGKLDVREVLAHAHPSMLDPRIGSKAVAPPLSQREIRDWASRGSRSKPLPRNPNSTR